MNGDSVDDAVIVHRPPAPEAPLEVRQWQERQAIFHAYEGGTVQHEPLNSGPIARGEVCEMDERGGHRRLGMHCPHNLGYRDDNVYVVED
jgi:hypothetical protein